MAVVTKVVAMPGVYHTLTGPATVTPARLKHWHDTVKALVKEGIHPPVVWGHHADAVPGGDRPTAPKYTAGRVLDSRLAGDGRLSFRLDVPGATQEGGRLLTTVEMPDGAKLPTAIDRVSIGARDWRDGKGRVWRDAPVHLALTPLPVMAEQGGGFEPAADFATYFALDDLVPPRPGKKPKPGLKPQPGPGEPGEEEPGEGMEGLGEEGEDAEGAEEAEELPPDGEKTRPCPFTVPAMLDKLRRFDIRLPTDTSEENLLERLWVAVAARDEDPEATGGQGQVTEEPGTHFSTMATTETTPDPRVAAYEARFQALARKQRLDRLDACLKRGLSPAAGKRLRDQITAENFALGDDGADRRAPIDDQLDLLEEVLPKHDYFGSEAREEPAPEDGAGRKRWRELADLQAKNSNLPARKE